MNIYDEDQVEDQEQNFDEDFFSVEDGDIASASTLSMDDIRELVG